MLSPYEIAAKSTMPALRAIIAKKLIKEYGFSQQQAADCLGITQAAVSNYTRGVRGATVSFEDEEEVQEKTDEIAEMLAEGVDKIRVMTMLTETCELIKQRRLMCGLHKQLEPDLDVDSCHICETPASISL